MKKENHHKITTNDQNQWYHLLSCELNPFSLKEFNRRRRESEKKKIKVNKGNSLHPLNLNKTNV